MSGSNRGGFDGNADFRVRAGSRLMDERTISVGSIDLAVAEAGAGGRPFLLLHGFTGAKEDFTDFLDRLAERGWHAVAPDQRGHGVSSKPASESDYSFPIYAADALGLADALGWSDLVLLGHSMGGMIAQHVVAMAPERLRGLVLMDTGPGPVKGIDPAMVDAATALVREQGMAALASALAGNDSPLDTEANQRVLAERPGYAEFGERKLLASSPHMYAAMIAGIRDQADRLDALRAAPRIPTLVIVGEQDRPFVAASERMADALDGDLAVIADGGHSPQFESPEAWWSALTVFLDKLS
jgi:pimeloyl-ACP methyl ester carboxylesterase